MEARSVESWPSGDLAYEPKWDGFRALAWHGDELRLDSRSRKPLLRYFPELAGALEALPAGTVLDGEVVVVVDGVTSFDDLSRRIHPAAGRIARLAEEMPAELVAFDILADTGEDVRPLPFRERRLRLEAVAGGLPAPWHLSPSTTDETLARRWFDELEAAGCDGVVLKRLDDPYLGGKRGMLKIKHRRTADCVVGGYRVHADGAGVGSLLLGLYDDAGRLHFVGHCSGFPDAARAGILASLAGIRSDASFSEGARVPGAESRWTGGKDLSWAPVEPRVVVEVSYDQIENGRFRHAARFHRWRPDKDPASCTFDQLARPAGRTFSDIVR